MGKVPTLDVFDLIDMKNEEMKEWIQTNWNEKNDIRLTDSEWFILNLINDEEILLADLAKNGKITRQGTHKLVKKLEERGLIVTEKPMDNKRSKFVRLTPLGLDCYEANQALRKYLEDNVREAIGHDAFDLLKKTLTADWQTKTEREFVKGER